MRPLLFPEAGGPTLIERGACESGPSANENLMQSELMKILS